MDPSAPLLPAAMLGLSILLILVCGAFMAFLPYLMPKRECFAVTVPDDAQSDPALRHLKRTYAGIMLVLTALCTLLCAGLAALGAEGAAALGMGASVTVLCVACYALMLYFRSKVQALKRERGWQAEGARTAAPVTADGLPRPLSLKWDALFLVPLVVSLVVCLAGYGHIPEEIPRQVGFDGQVTSYFHKSLAVACFPALVVAFIGGILMLSHWMMLRSKKFSDPSAPALSAWAYAMFVRAQTMLVVAGGLLCGCVGVVLAFSFVGMLSIGQAAALCLALVLVVAIASTAVSVVYGQNGSRLIAHAPVAGEGLPRDNDRYWKLGVFYANPEDPSLILPERFGVGWTMNWGRPAAWALLAGVVLAVIGFVMLVVALA